MSKKIVGYQVWLRWKTNNIFRPTWRFKEAVGPLRVHKSEALADVENYAPLRPLAANQRIEVREITK